jgi:hypothetical protein
MAYLFHLVDDEFCCPTLLYYLDIQGPMRFYIVFDGGLRYKVDIDYPFCYGKFEKNLSRNI